MRVALLGPYPIQLDPAAGGPPLPGGVDAVVLALAHGLARCDGVQVEVITAAPGLDAPRHIHNGEFAVHAIPRPRGGRLTGQRAVVAALQEQVRAVAPDVAHGHIAGIYARAAIASGAPSLVTLHGIIWREMQKAWPVSSWGDRLRWLSDGLWERWVVRRARDIIAISPYVLDEFRAGSSARFHSIENPVDDRFFSVPAGLPGRKRLLCVARIIPRKGILTLLAAFRRIVDEHPDASLTLVGETEAEPAYAASCRARAEELGVGESVRFLGGLSREAVCAEFASSDIFVLASEQETAPVSIAEAMAAGRPVVATDVGGSRAMVEDGVSGRIVKPGDLDAFAGAVRELLADPKRSSRMGQAGRAMAERRFRLDAVVKATLDVYRQLSGGRT